MAGRRSRNNDITVDILLRAYSAGLFPMADSADDPELFWVEPEIRGIIPLDDFHVSKSLAKAMRKKPFAIRFNTAFEDVMAGCAAEAPDRPSTWINATIRRLYTELHQIGHAHSVEAWEGDELVGGFMVSRWVLPSSAKACFPDAPMRRKSALCIWWSD